MRAPGFTLLLLVGCAGAAPGELLLTGLEVEPAGRVLDLDHELRGALFVANASEDAVMPLRWTMAQQCEPVGGFQLGPLLLWTLCDRREVFAPSLGELAPRAQAAADATVILNVVRGAALHDIAIAVDADRCCRTSTNCDGIGGDTTACDRALTFAESLGATITRTPARPNEQLISLRGAAFADAAYQRSRGGDPAALPIPLRFELTGMTGDGTPVPAKPLVAVISVCKGCSATP